MEELYGRIRAALQKKDRILAAIDGPCASGKTTLGKHLQEKYGGNLFSMDYFFLQPHQRTPARLAEPGGNVDYERFRATVLEPLVRGESFAYRPYDCGAGKLAEEIPIQPRPVNIIEGTYSLHPALRGFYDVKVILNIEKKEQLERLEKRNPRLLERFVNEWIPLEEQYFEWLKGTSL